jgi:methyl-accepting chemotaxis protein
MIAVQDLLRRFTIRFRMNGAIVMVLSLFAVLGLATFGSGRHLYQLNHEFMSHTVAAVRDVSEVRRQLAEVRIREKSMVIDYEDGVKVLQHREAWARHIDTLKRLLAARMAGADDGGNAPARTALAAIDSYVASTTRVLEQMQNGAYDTARAADRMLDRAKQQIADAEKAIAAIDAIVDRQAAGAMAEFEQSLQRTFLALAALLGLVVVVVVPLTLLNSRSITGPIVEARNTAEAIAGGDLTQTLQPRGADEATDLLRSLDAMRRSLAALVGEVHRTADTLSSTATEVASGNSDLSQRTEQAASNLQATASSVSQLTGTVRQSADAASQANQLASSAAQVAQRGGQVVAQVVSTMDEINASSRRIGDIIGTIDGIAFQTNILALNAAVEAARAGEQGRGFAVVAGEVRSLAQRSAEAAREIKSLIGASVERVETGTRQVRDAGGTMDEIVASVQRVSDIIAEISAAAGEQSAGIGQVNQAVTQLDQMTQQNAALVEQSAAAAESLKEQARRLSAAVSRFSFEPGQAGALAAPPAPLPTAVQAEGPAAAGRPPGTAPARPRAPVRAAPTTPARAGAPEVRSAAAAAPVAVAAGHDDWETF